jgi:hypothetical protein
VLAIRGICYLFLRLIVAESNPSHENEHEGFFERIFHHHEGNRAGNKDKNVDPQDKTDSQRPQGEQKEGEMDKLKDYLHKDEQLEEEGHEYGDLM